MGNIIVGVVWNMWEWSGDTEEDAESFLRETQTQ